MENFTSNFPLPPPPTQKKKRPNAIKSRRWEDKVKYVLKETGCNKWSGIKWLGVGSVCLRACVRARARACVCEILFAER
jgi:hypothetical protein